MKPIPFWNPLPEYEAIATEVHTAVSRVLASGRFILGPEVKKFERAFAHFVGCRYGIGVGNGTDAITIGLRTLGIGRGDEVITAANTAIPTVAAILAAHATPKLVDVLPDTLLMDPDKLARAITKRTRAVIPVHLYGQACDMGAITRIARRKKLFVLEDCAQAAGAEYRYKIKNSNFKLQNEKAKQSTHQKKVGSMGEIAAFSFYPTKIIGAYGDGGLITTNHAELAKRARSLRMYGTEGSYVAKIEGGINSRLDELQAAILSVKLKYIKKWIKKRQRLALRYTTSLKHTSLESPPVGWNTFTPDGWSNVYHLYVVRHKNRDALRARLAKHGIETLIHYPVPIHLMPAYRNLGYKKGDFPVSEAAAKTVLSLPLYPGLTNEEQDRVIEVVSLALRSQK